MRRFAIVAGVLLTLVTAIVWRPWGAAVGLILFPSFLWAAAKTASAMRYARTDSLVLFRSGLLTRKVSFAFADKIQGDRDQAVSVRSTLAHGNAFRRYRRGWTR